MNESSIKLSKEGIMNFVSSREDYDSGDPNSRLNSLHAKDKTMSFVSSTEDYKSTPKHSINLPNFLVDCPNIVRGCFDHSNRSFCDENNETLKLMIENEQIANWLDEMNQLKSNEDIDKSSPIFQSNPILEDNLIKMRTRLEYGDHLSEQTRFPIILPKDSLLTNLIIMNEHVQMSHSGAEQTKRLIRNKYWVIGSKRKIKSVLRTCKNRECRKWQLTPPTVPPPSLPKERMEFECFKAISLDGLGPIEMKNCSVSQYDSLCA